MLHRSIHLLTLFFTKAPAGCVGSLTKCYASLFQILNHTIRFVNLEKKYIVQYVTLDVLLSKTTTMYLCKTHFRLYHYLIVLRNGATSIWGEGYP